jgi:hypothetical protein
MSHRTLAAAAFGAVVFTIFTVASFAPASGAEGLAKGSSLLSLQLAQGDADLATPEAGSGGITAYDHPEWGGQLQFQHLLGENWALAVAFGIGTASETDKPADPGDPEFKYSQSSWNARVGADYFVHISPAFHLFVGPGFQYWTGHGKFEAGANSVEAKDATRIALDGRMGAHVELSNSVGLIGSIGHYWGHASADDAGAEVSWSASGNDGAMGFSFKF